MPPARAARKGSSAGQNRLHQQEQRRPGHAAERRPARRVPEGGPRAPAEQGDDARIDERIHRVGGGEHGAHDAVGHEVDAEVGLAQLRRRRRRQGQRVGRPGDRHRQHLPAEAQARPHRGAVEQARAGADLGEVGGQPAPAEQGEQRRGGELEDHEGEHAVSRTPSRRRSAPRRPPTSTRDQRLSCCVACRYQVAGQPKAQASAAMATASPSGGAAPGAAQPMATKASTTAGSERASRALNTCWARRQRATGSAATASRVAAARKPPSTRVASRPAQTRMKPSRPNSAAPMRVATSGSTTQRQRQPHRRRRVDLRQRGQQPRRMGNSRVRGRPHSSCLTTRRAVLSTRCRKVGRPCAAKYSSTACRAPCQ